MPDANDLSQRECEILSLVAQGASNKEIARDLHISTNTVKVHLRNIFAKVGANSRTEAAMYAVSSGLIDLGNNGEASNTSLTQSAAGGVIEKDERDSYYTRRNTWLLLGAVLVVIIGSVLGIFLLSDGNTPAASADQQNIPEVPRWQERAQLNTPRTGLALVAYQNSILAIGGEAASGVSGVVESYDPQNDAWMELSNKPLPVTNIGAEVIGGLVYVPGGELASGASTNVMEIYDPQTDEWSQGPSLPGARSAYALAAYEGKLYLFGGWDGENVIEDLFIFNPDAGSWTSGTPLSTPRAFPGVGSSEEEIYIFGGFDGEKPLDTTEIYRPNLEGSQENPWTDGESLPQPRYAMGVASLAETFHIFGGTDGESDPLPSLQYATTSDSWETYQTPFEGQWSHLGAVPLGTHIYLAGGEVDGEPSASNLTYQAIYLINLPVVR